MSLLLWLTPRTCFPLFVLAENLRKSQFDKISIKYEDDVETGQLNKFVRVPSCKDIADHFMKQNSPILSSVQLLLYNGSLSVYPKNSEVTSDFNLG